MLRVLAVALLLATVYPAVAADEDPLAAPLAAFYAARTDAEVESAVGQVLAAAPEIPALLAALGRGPIHGPPAAKGFSVRKIGYPDGVERPWHLFVPESYDPKVPSPVLLHLHGGVSRPDLIPEEQMKEYCEFWAKGAAERGVIVAFPMGQKNAEWWTENGAEGIERILLDLKRDFTIDEDSVYVSGFSDGASGSFYLALTRVTSFAGFIPLNGHPAVASGASGRQLHLVNAGLRPFFMVNTQEDQLYPTRQVLPFVEGLLRAGAAVLFTSYPGIGHEAAYMDAERERIFAFMDRTPREPLPKRIAWETAYPENGRVSWVTVLSLGDTPGAPEFDDVNVPVPEDRVRLGVIVDRTFAGPGVRIDQVADGSLAQSMDLKAGDVIVGIDEAQITTMDDLLRTLTSRRRGKPIEVRYLRQDQAGLASATIPPYVPEPAFPRTMPSGRIEVAADGNRIDVRLRGVTKYALDLSPAQFDLGQEIVVTTNGKESFKGKVAPDLGHLLRCHSRDRDRSMLFLARLTVDVKP